MTAKQIKFFGTKRQKEALKAKRSNSAKKAKRKAHRARTAPKRKSAVVRNPAPKKKRKRATGSAKRKRKASKQNPGAIYALVNPARKKGHKKVAAKKKSHKKTSQRNPAGKKSRSSRKRGQRNPAGLKPMDWLQLGGGALIGGIGATAIPNMVMSASNTGPVGYLAMLATTGVLAAVAHMVSKKPTLTAGVIAGGVGATIRRVIQDYSPAGSVLANITANSGMGDYLSNWNFTTPQLIGGPGNSTLGTPGSFPVNVAGAPGYSRALASV